MVPISIGGPTNRLDGRISRQKSFNIVGVAGEKHVAAIDKAHEARRAEVALHRSTT